MTALDAFSASATPFDDSLCAQEPIHVPGTIQPHGMLVAVSETTGDIMHLSTNASPMLRVDATAALGGPFVELAITSVAKYFEADVSARSPTPVMVGLLEIDGRTYNAITHGVGGVFVIELEQVAEDQAETLDSVYPSIRGFMETMQGQSSPDELSTFLAKEVRAITGFDRVMIYRFDTEWNGTVIAQDRNDRLPSYLDLRFPASDIPAQARQLYRSNRQRLIANATYEPVALLSEEGAAPLDMSYSVLRSVSPVHLEYMRNMQTASSMSISILIDGNLWGLISCHSAEPRGVPMHIRTTCDFLSQMYALQIRTDERSDDATERLERQAIQSELLAFMAAETNYISGLLNNPRHLLRFVDADSAAVVFEQKVTTIGPGPSEAEVWKIVDWLSTTQAHDQVFSTANLSTTMPDSEALAARASGMMAISISQLHPSYVIWFRKELVQTVKWGGNPTKDATADGRLHPRRSFDMWKETVRNSALPWSPAQRDVAGSLRNAIIGIVMRKAEEMAVLTDELRQSNKELEAFSYSVSHDLRAPFRHIVGYAELLKEEDSLANNERGLRYVDTIIDSAFSAGKLVDDLLGFAQMSRSTLSSVKVNMNRLVKEVQRVLCLGPEHDRIEWVIDNLAPVWGDPNMLRLVVQNLLENAMKYSRASDPPRIRVWSEVNGPEIVYAVQDNGVGFDMAYVGKLFGVFQRLHRMEDYEGTGIGLANVRRIVERHRGRTWAEGQVGKGATFYFALPRTEKE